MIAFPRTRTLVGLTLTLASSVLLCACGKHGPANPNQTPAPTSTAPIAAAASSIAQSPAAKANGTAPAATASVATASEPASASSTSTASGALSVSRVTLGNNIDSHLEVTDPGNSFTDDSKTIYASVDTQGSSSNASLNAHWSYLEGKGQLISNVTQSIATDGPAVTTFKLQNPNLWPDGKYQVEIFLDGKPVATRAFLIHKH